MHVCIHIAQLEAGRRQALSLFTLGSLLFCCATGRQASRRYCSHTLTHTQTHTGAPKQIFMGGSQYIWEASESTDDQASKLDEISSKIIILPVVIVCTTTSVCVTDRLTECSGLSTRVTSCVTNTGTLRRFCCCCFVQAHPDDFILDLGRVRDKERRYIALYQSGRWLL